MSNIFVSPEWFFGYDILLEFIFAIITLLVSFYAWKIHKVTDERNIKLFSMAFLFISISYFAQSALNLIILSKLQEQVCGVIGIQSIYHLNLFGIYFHAILFLVGLLILTYVALKIFSHQTFVLLFLLVFTSLYFSPNKTFMLYLLSVVLLGFIVYYYFTNYINNRKTTTLFVLVAILLLFFGYVYFMLAMTNPLYYVIGHLLEFASYIIILVNLLIIIRLGNRSDKNVDINAGNKMQRLKNGKKTR